MPGRAAARLREMDSARASARRLASPSIFHLSIRSWLTSRCASFDACVIWATMELASAVVFEFCAANGAAQSREQNAAAHSHALRIIMSPHENWKSPTVLDEELRIKVF